MKSIKRIIFIAIVAFLSSCASGIHVPSGALVTTNPIGSKVGVVEQKVWLGFIPLDVDVSIATAAKKGKITKIASVDYTVTPGFLFLNKTYRTIVTGTNDEVEPVKKGKKKRKSRSRSKGRR